MILNMDLKDEAVVGRATPDPLSFAFSSKKSAHAGGSGRPLDQVQAQVELKHALEKPITRANSRCLYIHIPFCRVRCTFCSFFQYASSQTLIDQYFAALCHELKFKAKFTWSQAAPFQAVYIGGGTPTALTAAQLSQLGKLIQSQFPLTPDCEITLEGRINGFDNVRFEAALEGGFNRFSLGVQSFDTTVRKKAKRLDDRETVIQRLSTLSTYNAAPIVIDLLYGLPYQDSDIWLQDLRAYLDLKIDGIDLYQLINMPQLPLNRMVEQGKLPPLADTATKAAMFKQGVEFMAQHHQRRLSNNHWASTNRERSIYNSLAKSNAEILPLGAGAGGNVNGLSMMQERDLDSYIEAVKQNHFASAFTQEASPFAQINNQIKHGFDQGVVKRCDLPEYFDALRPLFEIWQQRGLVTLSPHYLTLSLAGQFWSVTMAQILIQAIAHQPAPQMGAA